MKYLVGKSPELDNEKSTEELDPDIIKPIGQLGWFNQPCTKEQRDNNEHGECEKVSSGLVGVSVRPLRSKTSMRIQRWI